MNAAFKHRETVANPAPSRRTIGFVYADGPSQTGQRFATQVLVTHLPQAGAGWKCFVIGFPSRDNGAGGLAAYALRLLKAWWRVMRSARNARVFHFNLGQNPASFVRDGIAIVSVRMLNPGCRICGSLHGGFFTAWGHSSLRAQAFRLICNRADVLTLLGPGQFAAARRLGIKRPQVVLMDNTCELSPVSSHELQSKHAAGGPLRVLFLSNLIETKGYTVYLESLELLGARAGMDIEAVLAGDYIPDPWSSRFPSPHAAAAWVDAALARINACPRIKIRRVTEARGEVKARLFREAQIFVFPSVLEAQPIVLIEALSAGCAIIASTAGEIASTLPDQAGVLLDPCGANEIAGQIERLASSGPRLALAERGLALFHQRFSLEQHLRRWQELFEPAS